MKIRTEEDVALLDARIKEELGISVSKYKNEEVVETFVSMLVFPEYILTWTFQPLLLALAAYAIGFFVIDLVHVQYVLYAIIGLVLFLVVGMLLGLMMLTNRLKTDVLGIMDYSMGIMKAAAADIDTAKVNIPPEGRKDALRMLYKGIIHIVTLPMLTTAISAKIPIVGGLINRFVRKVIVALSDKITIDESMLESHGSGLAILEDEVGAVAVKAGNKSLKKVMDVSVGVAQFPFKVLLYLFGGLLFLFIYLIW